MFRDIATTGTSTEGPSVCSHCHRHMATAGKRIKSGGVIIEVKCLLKRERSELMAQNIASRSEVIKVRSLNHLQVLCRVILTDSERRDNLDPYQMDYMNNLVRLIGGDPELMVPATHPKNGSAVHQMAM